MFIILSLSLLLLLFVACGNGGTPSDLSAESSAEETDTEASLAHGLDSLSLVALGDSIPRGYGLSDPSSQSFPALVAQHFSGIAEEVSINNYAVDGMTSSGLLTLLEEQKREIAEDADVILICIGANNILRHAYDLLHVGDSGVLSLFNAYWEFLAGDKTDTAAADALSDYFGAVGEYATGEEFGGKIDAGVALLGSDIPKIIAEIRSVNNDAAIYFMTVYSPYEGMNLTLPYVDNTFMLADISDRSVKKLNDVINNASADNGYTVVDIYTLFGNDTGKNVNAGINFIAKNLDYDPHPSQKGHSLIAEEFIRVISEDFA